MGPIDVDFLLFFDHRLVFGHVDGKGDLGGRFSFGGSAGDHHRFTGGQVSVHACSTDPDSLLPPGLLAGMELGSIKQSTKNLGQLRRNDAWPIIPYENGVLFLGGRRDFNDNCRQVFRFLAGIQRVVDRFPDGSQESSRRAVKTQQVAILGEELTDGDVFLLGRQLLCLVG